MDVKRKRIALYRSLVWGGETVFYTDSHDGDISDYVRISDFVYVDFKPRDQGEIIAQEVKALDAVLDELMSKIQSVQAKKAELLSITHEASA